MIICNCGKEFAKKNSLKSHARFCSKYKKIEKEKSVYKINDLTYRCECGKTFEKSQSLNSHFGYCETHRMGKPIKKRGQKKGHMNGWEKFSGEDILKIRRKSGETFSSRIKSGEITHSFLGKKHTKESKQKMSNKANENNNGFVKCKYYEVYCPYLQKYTKVQGSYEKKYSEYLNLNGIKWERDKKNNLRYILHEEDYTHTYYPDFYLPDTDEYIEIKGFWWKSKDDRVNDKRKMEAVIRCNPDKKIKIMESKDLDLL